MKQLIIVSPSTEKFAKDWEYDEKIVVTSLPTEETLKLKQECQAIAIGGGSVIDTAKIISDKVIAIPTTFSGASCTSHACIWGKDFKKDIKTKIPETLLIPEYEQRLFKEAEEFVRDDMTAGVDRGYSDAQSHIYESLSSKNLTVESYKYAKLAEKLLYISPLQASILAGKAIEITGTNIIHVISYPLTYLYEVSHSSAVGFVLSHLYGKLEYDMPFTPKQYPAHGKFTDRQPQYTEIVKRIVEEAYKYPQLKTSNRTFTKELLIKWLLDTNPNNRKEDCQ